MTDINSTELTKKYPDTPEYRFAVWLSSQSREYIEWFEEEYRKSMEAEKKREKEGE